MAERSRFLAAIRSRHWTGWHLYRRSVGEVRIKRGLGARLQHHLHPAVEPQRALGARSRRADVPMTALTPNVKLVAGPYRRPPRSFRAASCADRAPTRQPAPAGPGTAGRLPTTRWTDVVGRGFRHAGIGHQRHTASIRLRMSHRNPPRYSLQEVSRARVPERRPHRLLPPIGGGKHLPRALWAAQRNTPGRSAAWQRTCFGSIGR